jgi:membrane-associated phospholipid phosphatase
MILDYPLFIAKISPIFYLSMPIITYLYNSDKNHIIFLKGFIFSEILNKLLKYLLRMPRPTNASNCSIINKLKLFDLKSYGMPSGHSQCAWYSGIYYSLLIYFDTNYNKFTKIVCISGLLISSAFVSYSRIHIYCHTLFQVLFGGVLGGIIGILTYYNKNTIKSF